MPRHVLLPLPLHFLEGAILAFELGLDLIRVRAVIGERVPDLVEGHKG